MDAFEEQIRRENQNSTRRRVLTHLQAAIRETREYHQLELTLDGDFVIITHSSGSQQRVNIAGDSEPAMILDIVEKIMY